MAAGGPGHLVNTDNYHQHKDQCQQEQQQCLVLYCTQYSQRLFRIEVKLFGGVLDTLKYIWRLQNPSIENMYLVVHNTGTVDMGYVKSEE